MRLRDPMMGESYFDKWIQFKQEEIPDCTRIANRPGPYPNIKSHAQFIFVIFRLQYELLIERYSRGDPLCDLKAAFPEMINAWEWAYREELKVFTPEEMANRKQFKRNLDFYIVCLWLVSLARCLEVDDALLARMLLLCGNEGEDWLFEYLVAARAPGRKTAAALCYPQTHGALKQAIEEPIARDRARLMQRFLNGWYPSLKKTYWHDCHKGPEGGGYFGYWCFEAAGAVKAGGFDDADWRDLAYYPKDLTGGS